MPLPASVPTGTVSGTWYTPSGNLAVGEIIFLLTHEIEIPDDADGVVIPIRHEVAVPAGQLNATLPAGFYNVLIRLSELYYKAKVVEIVASQNLNLPDAIGVVPPEELVTPVRSVNGNLPDASGNITVVGGGGVVSVNTQTGVVVLDAGDLAVDQSTWKVLAGPDIQSSLNRADGIALNSMSTGIRAGGILTVDGGLGVGSTVSISAVAGQILNNTNAASPTFNLIQAGPWAAQTPLYQITYWYVDAAGVLQQGNAEPTHSELRTRLYLYRTASFGGVVTGTAPIGTTVQQSAVNIRDLALAIGQMRLSGSVVSSAATNLTFQASAGEIYSYGIAGITTPTDPSTVHLTAFNTSTGNTFRYTTSTTQDTTDRTLILPGNYQVGGVATAIPGSPNRVGVHWVFVFPSSANYRLAYGTAYYDNFADALTAISTVNPYDAAPANYPNNAFLIGAILATKSATNLSDPLQARFVTTNQFGAMGGSVALSAITQVKGFATTGKITGTFGPGDTSGTWTVAPAPWRVTVPAAVGDILCLDPSVIAQVTADAEMDVCSLNGNTPLRYYSSGTSSQAANGHGGLYMGTQFSTKLSPIRWVVTADDIVSGNVTLSYMFRSGSGITWGSGTYPNEITLINEGTP